MKPTISKPTLLRDGSDADMPVRSVAYWTDTRSPETEAAQEAIIQSTLSGDDSNVFDEVVRYATVDRDYQEAAERVSIARKRNRPAHLPQSGADALWAWIRAETGKDEFWANLKKFMNALSESAVFDESSEQRDRQKRESFKETLEQHGTRYRSNQKLFESLIWTLGEEDVRKVCACLALPRESVRMYRGKVLPPEIPEFAECLDQYDDEIQQSIAKSIEKKNRND